MNRLSSLALIFLLSPAGAFLARPAADAPPEKDAILRAMRDELQRSRMLRVVNLDMPYYTEYSVDDATMLTISATLGGLISTRRNQARMPRVHVRVGDYQFDNTNYIYSDLYTGSRFDSDRMPLDENYLALRETLWLANDRAYKTAVQAISRKRAALKNVTSSENLPDFSKADPAQRILTFRQPAIDEKSWAGRVRALSALFAEYPRITESGVEFSATASAAYYLNSEGSAYRIPDSLGLVRARASALAADGSRVRDAIAIMSQDPSALPPDADIRRWIQEMAANLTALADAPPGEQYVGPVLFEGVAAPQLFAHLLGDNLAIVRQPVTEPGRPVSLPQSELEGRLESRILPEWIDVVDDPTQKEWRGRPLFGHYEIDLEAVVPKPLTLVEKGVLKSFLLTRQPVKGFTGSNGRARLPGNFGAKSAVFSNLFVKASETVPAGDLKKKLLEMVQRRSKPYGLIVRKIDYPSSGSMTDLRRMAAESRGGSGRLVSEPVLVYKVFPDGKEELVRGLRFRGLSTRSLRDMVAASDDLHTLDFLNSNAPLAMMGGSSFVTGCSVIAPSVLFDDLELERPREQVPTAPVVPPPALTVSR